MSRSTNPWGQSLPETQLACLLETGLPVWPRVARLGLVGLWPGGQSLPRQACILKTCLPVWARKPDSQNSHLRERTGGKNTLKLTSLLLQRLLSVADPVCSKYPRAAVQDIVIVIRHHFTLSQDQSILSCSRFGYMRFVRCGGVPT